MGKEHEVDYMAFKSKFMLFPIPLKVYFKNDARYGREKDINIIPRTIFSGIATRNMFILGTVRATIPSATLVNNNAAITGAATLIATINILVTILIKSSANDPFI